MTLNIDIADLVAQLELDEARCELVGFDHADAIQLGTAMVQRAIRDDAPIIVDIRKPGMIIFRAAMPGTTPENEAWLDRKANTVFRYEASSALVDARFTVAGIDPATTRWFDADRFAATGGSVPIRARGVGVVVAVTVSGLTSRQDHDFAVDAISAFAAERHTST
jgi:uncharacterized protein (UPF0303 family)